MNTVNVIARDKLVYIVVLDIDFYCYTGLFSVPIAKRHPTEYIFVEYKLMIIMTVLYIEYYNSISKTIAYKSILKKLNIT